MPTEYRYMHRETWTVNGLSAKKLTTTYPSSSHSWYFTDYYARDTYWGIRVWKRNQNGDEFEITDGTPVAIFGVPYSQGTHSGSETWNCPETNLESSDAIVVRTYVSKDGGRTWEECDTFITEQLGASKLEAQTWTVHYMVEIKRVVPLVYYYLHYTIYQFGEYVATTYIDNFAWAIPYNLTLEVDKTQGYIGDTFIFYGTLTGNGMPISGATVTLYKDDVSTGLSDTTDDNGNYSIPWTADEVGSHNFFTEAVW